ncbi:MAG: hypothetical protein DRG50_09055 [Deltaproteobacteria bacterium]|nr:MAG: hypothetical protein DRG50_09055 [Deltaproteobacteria bacterium]
MLLGGPGSDKAVDLWKKWEGSQIIAPGLIFYEIGNGLHRLAINDIVSYETAEEFLDVALGLGLKIYQEASLHRQALQIARRFKLSATYDAHYLALAEMTESEFWTADRKLFEHVRKEFPLIKVIDIP